MEYQVKYYWDSISGDTLVNILNENISDITKNYYSISVHDLYEKKKIGENFQYDIQGFDLETKKIVFNKIKDIIFHGEQEIFNILTKNKLEINSTNNHIFVILDKYSNTDVLSELKYLDIDSIVAINSDYSNIFRLNTSRVYDIISCIKYNGRGEVFTIELEENTSHTYFANGFLLSDISVQQQ